MNTRVGFSTPRHFNPVSWLVRLLTGSACSHAFFIYYDDEWCQDFVLEAHEFGFRVVLLARFQKKNDIVAIFKPKTSIETGVQFVAVEYLGSTYDYGGLLGTLVLLLGRWLHRKWRNPWSSARAVFCSEAVTLALQKAGYAGADQLISQDTTPQDLLEFFTREAHRVDT